MKNITLFFIFLFAIQAKSQNLSFSIGGGATQNFIKVSGFVKSPMVKFRVPVAPNAIFGVQYNFKKKYGVGLNLIYAQVNYNTKFGPVILELDQYSRIIGYSTRSRGYGISVPYWNLYGFYQKKLKKIDFNFLLGASVFVMNEYDKTSTNNGSFELVGLDHRMVYRNFVDDDRLGGHLGLFYGIEAVKKLGKRSNIFLSFTGVKSWTTISTVPIEIIVNNIKFNHAFLINGSFFGCNLGYKYTINLKKKDKTKN